jgi:hypothetical protein
VYRICYLLRFPGPTQLFAVSYTKGYSGSLSYSCTIPLPPSGAGNLTNEPAFVDLAAGDLRRGTTSPCINAGNNASATASTDLDGYQRIVGGTVDMGAYECQVPASLNYCLWLQGYGLSTVASATYTDSVADGLNNWQEWICGTVPTNSSSLLTLLSVSNTLSGAALNWQSVTNRTYFLQCSTNLGIPPAFSSIQSNIVGQSGTTTWTDTAATNNSRYLYRVGVQ